MARPIKVIKTRPVPIRLPFEWIGKLKKISDSMGVSSYAETVRIAIKKYIDDYEDNLLGRIMEETESDGTIDTEAFLKEIRPRTRKK